MASPYLRRADPSQEQPTTRDPAQANEMAETIQRLLGDNRALYQVVLAAYARIAELEISLQRALMEVERATAQVQALAEVQEDDD